MGYISTGGGAFLEVLEGKTLPAFEILSAARAADAGRGGPVPPPQARRLALDLRRPSP